MAITATILAFAGGALAPARETHANAKRHAAADCRARPAQANHPDQANPDDAGAAQHLIDNRHPWAGSMVSRLRRVHLTQRRLP